MRQQTFSILAVLGVLSSSCLFAQTSGTRLAGTVKSVTGNAVTITTDSGSEASFTFAEAARLLRAAPGQTDLKSAVPIKPAEIQPGDRIAARAQQEAGALLATFAVVMRREDVAQQRRQELEDWRKGVGGIVKDVDPNSNSITVTQSGKPIAIRLSKATSILRYAPDSVRFEDAKPGTLEQIKPGDQLRARGTKNAEGSEFSAQAVVSGTFREIAGTVTAKDPGSGTLTVQDLATKKSVEIKIGPDSQLHKLPEFVAMRIAMRLKGGGATANGPAMPPPGPQGGSPKPTGPRGPDAGAGPGGGPAGSNGGPPDLQQMLARMPAISLSDLNKGEAVMLVATEGTQKNGPTAIMLVTGVEAILSAAPPGAGSASMILSPWNLGGGGTGGGDSSQ